MQVIIFLLGIFFLFLIGVYPFLVLFLKTFSFQNFFLVFTQNASLLALTNTFKISTLVTLVSLFISLPLAWLLSRSDLKGKKLWRFCFSLPFAIPSYIGGMCWIYLANPQTGLLNLWLGENTFNIYTSFGLILAMSCFYYPFAFLSILQAMDRLDPSMEEAARISGASRLKVFFKITLPLIRGATLSGGLLVFLASSACFGLPAVLGTPARIYLMTTRIFTFQRVGSIGAIENAGALSFILLLLGIFVLFANQMLLRGKSFQTLGGKSARLSHNQLGFWQYPIQFFLILSFGVFFLAPLGALVLVAFSEIPGVWSVANIGLQNFKNIYLNTDETWRALGNSLQFSFWASTLSVFLGAILAYIYQKSKIKGRGAIVVLASVPYTTPGTVLSFAMIMAFSYGVLGVPLKLSGTGALIVLAYLAKYLNFSMRSSSDGLAQIDNVLAEAARVSGASWWQTFLYVWLPLLAPNLIASWFLVFMPTFSELTMTILLTGPGLETLGTLIFQLQQYSDGAGGAAVLALTTIVIIIFINIGVRIFSRGKFGL